MPANTAKRLFTVDEYQRMEETGVLSDRDRVELVHGEILTMSPIGPPHMAAVDRATRALVTTLGERAIVRVQGAVVLDRFNAPQPDITILRPKEDFYRSGHAGPSDILLIMEVSDSSLEYDQTIKLQLYAEMGITEYWIADLQNDCVLVHSEPRNGVFTVARPYQRGDSIAPKLLPDCFFTIEVLLP